MSVLRLLVVVSGCITQAQLGLLGTRVEVPAKRPASSSRQPAPCRGGPIHGNIPKAPPKSALLVIDMQYDFINGSLPVSGATEIIPAINDLVKLPGWSLVAFTMDYHPWDHISFAANHPGMEVFDSIELNYTADGMLCGERYSDAYFGAAQSECMETEVEHTVGQELWPVHCVQNTFGGKIHEDVSVPAWAVQVRKGYTSVTDSYGAIFNQVGGVESNLVKLFKMAGVKNVYVVGLALDYCVKFTAIQAQQEGFATYVITDVTRAVTEETGEQALEAMTNEGVSLVEASSLGL